MTSNDYDSLLIIPDYPGMAKIPEVNFCLVDGRPLIYRTIDLARDIVDDRFICVSTDKKDLIDLINKYDFRVPFIRSVPLDQGRNQLRQIVMHAIAFYEELDTRFERVIILNPTFPYIDSEFIQKGLKAHHPSIECVASVISWDRRSGTKPYIENEDGYLELIGENLNRLNFQKKKRYQINDSLYIISVDALSEDFWIDHFSKIVKIEMSKKESFQLLKNTDLTELISSGKHV